MPTPFLVIFGNFFHLFLVRPKKRNINKCWLTFLKKKKQLKYVQKNPNGVWFQLLKDMLTGIARQSRLLHWILIYQYLYMDKNLCKLTQSTNLQKTPRGWSQILIQHSMPLLHEFKCFFTFSLFHIFTFSDSFSCHECIVENFITDPIFSQPKPRGPLINFLQSSFCLLGIERVLLVPASPNYLDFVSKGNWTFLCLYLQK